MLLPAEPMKAGDPRLFRARETVRPEWIDDNNHMNAAHYLALVKQPAIDLHRLWDYAEDFRRRTGESNFVLAAHVVYLRELVLGQSVIVTARITDLQRKRMSVLFEIIEEEKGYVAALVRYVLGHVRYGSPPRAAEMPEDLAARLAAVHAAHAEAPLPKGYERLPPLEA